MAAVDYFGIAERIVEILKLDDRLQTVPITAEAALPMTTLDQGLIVVEATRRRAMDGQPIAAGRRLRLEVDYAIWCYGFALDQQQGAPYRVRDDLIGRVELVLMANRQLRDGVNVLYLNGGEFDTVQIQRGFLIGGSVLTTVEALAIL